MKLSTPVIIPSLKTADKRGTLLIDKCLNDFQRHYEADITVIAQDYSDHELLLLRERYGNVHFVPFPKGMMAAFNECKNIAIKRGLKSYIFMESDIMMSHRFDKNPTLIAYEKLFNLMPEKIGIVSAYSNSLIHFHRDSDELIKIYANPAQCMLINTTAIKGCEYNEPFSAGRGDTDMTFQIGAKGFLSIILQKYFTFHHSVSISKDPEKIKRAYEVHQIFADKWDVKVKKDKRQVLLPTFKNLCEYDPEDIKYLNRNFDYSVIRDYYPNFWKIKSFHSKELF